MSRPIGKFKAARDLALANREMTYEGYQCRKCNGTRRYASSSGCVVCIHRKMSNRRKDGNYSKRGAPVWDKDVSMKPIRAWPEMQLEDAETHDHIGSRTISHYTPYNAVRGSSMADIE